MDEERFKFKMQMVLSAIIDRNCFICTQLDRAFKWKNLDESLPTQDFQKLYAHMNNSDIFGMFGDPSVGKNQERRIEAFKRFTKWALVNKAYERYKEAE